MVIKYKLVKTYVKNATLVLILCTLSHQSLSDSLPLHLCGSKTSEKMSNVITKDKSFNVGLHYTELSPSKALVSRGAFNIVVDKQDRYALSRNNATDGHHGVISSLYEFIFTQNESPITLQSVKQNGKLTILLNKSSNFEDKLTLLSYIRSCNTDAKLQD